MRDFEIAQCNLQIVQLHKSFNVSIVNYWLLYVNMKMSDERNKNVNGCLVLQHSRVL